MSDLTQETHVIPDGTKHVTIIVQQPEPPAAPPSRARGFSAVGWLKAVGAFTLLCLLLGLLGVIFFDETMHAYSADYRDSRMQRYQAECLPPSEGLWVAPKTRLSDKVQRFFLCGDLSELKIAGVGISQSLPPVQAVINQIEDELQASTQETGDTDQGRAQVADKFGAQGRDLDIALQVLERFADGGTGPDPEPVLIGEGKAGPFQFTPWAVIAGSDETLTAARRTLEVYQRGLPDDFPAPELFLTSGRFRTIFAFPSKMQAQAEVARLNGILTTGAYVREIAAWCGGDPRSVVIAGETVYNCY